MSRVAVGFVLGAAAAVLGEYMARSILAHAEMRAEAEGDDLPADITDREKQLVLDAALRGDRFDVVAWRARRSDDPLGIRRWLDRA